MNDTYAPVADVTRIARGEEAARLATAMYDRIIDELSSLDPTDWETATVCTPWTVADIVRHLVGAAKSHASMRETVRQIRYGSRHKTEFDGNDLDAMNALQVADHAGLDPVELLEELRAIAPRAVAKRMSRPGLMRKVKLPNAPGGSTATGMPDSLTLGDLFTVILTRDVFIHRLDITRATGRTVDVDANEGRLVEDVVAEWAGRHGSSFRLDLTGPAGGRFEAGTGGPEIALDALEFSWILSGRGAATHPLLETRVLF
jgi:uncharacterized protein (TIGR03083 family)